MKPRVAAIATSSSDSDTEPIALRGSMRPTVMSVGVVTGPHPPPPMASTTPPTVPSGIRKCALSCDGSVGLRVMPNANRASM